MPFHFFASPLTTCSSLRVRSFWVCSGINFFALSGLRSRLAEFTEGDGSVNMAAPAPRGGWQADFSGLWTTAEPNREREAWSGPNNQQAAGTAPIVEDKPVIPGPSRIASDVEYRVDLREGCRISRAYPDRQGAHRQRRDRDPHILFLPDNFLPRTACRIC